MAEHRRYRKNAAAKRSGLTVPTAWMVDLMIDIQHYEYEMTRHWPTSVYASWCCDADGPIIEVPV